MISGIAECHAHLNTSTTYASAVRKYLDIVYFFTALTLLPFQLDISFQITEANCLPSPKFLQLDFSSFVSVI